VPADPGGGQTRGERKHRPGCSGGGGGGGGDFGDNAD